MLGALVLLVPVKALQVTAQLRLVAKELLGTQREIPKVILSGASGKLFLKGNIFPQER